MTNARTFAVFGLQNDLPSNGLDNVARCAVKSYNAFKVESSDGDITRLLKALRAGDHEAESELLRIVYPELRRLAAGYLRRERPDHTLQATELVNEVYLRVAGHAQQLKDSGHLRAVAARGMRQVLVDHARRRRAGKRGGEACKIDLDGLEIGCPAMDEKVLALDEALSRLSEWDARQARVVELKFYGGLTNEEIGEVLGMSSRTVEREWKQARDWLYHEIGR
jgi:RNA polymerase sigma-70 factor (ECF subfamily)